MLTTERMQAIALCADGWFLSLSSEGILCSV